MLVDVTGKLEAAIIVGIFEIETDLVTVVVIDATVVVVTVGTWIEGSTSPGTIDFVSFVIEVSILFSDACLLYTSRCV